MTYDSFDAADRNDEDKTFTVDFYTLDWIDPARMPMMGSGWAVRSMPVMPNSATVTTSGDTHTAHVPGTFSARVTVCYSQSMWSYLWACVLWLFVVIARVVLFVGFFALVILFVAFLMRYGLHLLLLNGMIDVWNSTGAWLLAMWLRGVSFLLSNESIPSATPTQSPGAPLGQRVS